jgi:RNA polymerase sigma-70 factor (ECF subfamily)
VSHELPSQAQFASIFAEHAPFVWRVLRRQGVRDADLEDACQEVFVVVLKRLADFEGRSTLRTWLYGIALRVASAFRAKAHVRKEVIMRVPPEAAQPAEVESGAARAELAHAIGAALAQLPADKREVFELYEIDGMSMAEVAAALGCPLKTAFSRLYAARAEVRAHIQRARTTEAVRGDLPLRSQGVVR